MARPIKETPVLRGKNARDFEKAIKENEKKKVPRADYERALKVFDTVTGDCMKKLIAVSG